MDTFEKINSFEVYNWVYSITFNYGNILASGYF